MAEDKQQGAEPSNSPFPPERQPGPPSSGVHKPDTRSKTTVWDVVHCYVEGFNREAESQVTAGLPALAQHRREFIKSSLPIVLLVLLTIIALSVLGTVAIVALHPNSAEVKAVTKLIWPIVVGTAGGTALFAGSRAVARRIGGALRARKAKHELLPQSEHHGRPAGG
jgi:hypothetical protein